MSYSDELLKHKLQDIEDSQNLELIDKKCKVLFVIGIMFLIFMIGIFYYICTNNFIKW